MDKFREVAVLRGHLSSVKCLTVQSEEGGGGLLVSGGGRAEVRVWSCTMVGDRMVCSGVGTALLRGTDSQRKKPWKAAQEELVVEGETRYLAVDTKWEVVKQKMLIYLACSDGLVRLYRYFTLDQKLEVVREVEHHTHCVLHVMVVENMVLTATTGGHLAVWDRKAMEKQEGPIKPLVETTVHQSGVNCIAVNKVDTSTWLVLSGGDDTDVVLTRLEVTGTAAEVIPVWCSGGRMGHAAQVTGLCVVGNLVVTTSVDQRVVVWRVMQEECEWVASKCCSVADVAAIDCWMEGNRLMCSVVGVGMELVSLDLLS